MADSSTGPANVVRATKQPPPERPEAANLRTKIVLSFWAVILLLGIPTWLKTTSIYRANLPLQDMLDWADGLVSVEEYRTKLIRADNVFRILLRLFLCISGYQH